MEIVFVEPQLPIVNKSEAKNSKFELELETGIQFSAKELSIVGSLIKAVLLTDCPVAVTRRLAIR
jgi:hypothetical protein